MIVIPPLYDSRTGSLLVLHCARPISRPVSLSLLLCTQKNVIKKRTYNSLIPHFISTGYNSDYLFLLTHLAAKLRWVEHALCLPNICVFWFCPTFYATKNIWKRRRSMTLPLTSPTLSVITTYLGWNIHGQYLGLVFLWVHYGVKKKIMTSFIMSLVVHTVCTENPYLIYLSL